MAALRSPFRATAVLGGVYDWYVRAACARPGLAAVLLTLVCLPALALSVAFFSHIEAGLQELLPPTAPSVRALTRLHTFVGGKTHLAVIAHSRDRAANEQFISELTARLGARHLPEVGFIEADVKPDRAWLLKRALLLMPRSDFDRLLARFDAAAQAEKQRLNPLRLDLGEDEAPPPFDWTAVEREVNSELDAHDRYPSGYLETPDGKRVVALVWLNGSDVDLAPSANLMDAVAREIQALRPRFPSMEVAFNGEVPNMVEENAAILADLSISSVFVVLLVGACISFYFRSLRAVATVVLTLLPGLLFAFALGRLTVGGLNSNTTFLGTIIAGNGINYPLLLLAYYRAQPTALSIDQALSAAARQALPGTLGAALTASAAYGGLAASDFRGFSQFGWLGGWGMALVWVGTYLAAPVLVPLFRPPRRLTRSTRVQHFLHDFFSRGPLATAVCASVVALVVGATAVGVVRASRSGVYEMDLRALRNQESIRHGSASWDEKMHELFGVWLNPVVALAENPEHRELAASKLRQAFAEKDPGGLQSVETFERFVPPLEDQQYRLEQLDRIAPLVRRVPPLQVPQKLRPRLTEWFARDALHPIEISEPPSSLLSAFRETSGRVDRLVLIYPSLHVDYDDGRNLSRFATIVRSVQLPPDVIVGGGFLFMEEILRLVREQALHVVLVVTVLVGIVLLVIFRHDPWRVTVSLVTMLAVAFCSQATMIALGTKINFLNFAALPITIGVGADYVVNLLGAMTSLGVNARTACVRMGGAILLCSLTTIIGYLSLMLAKSGALQSFGWAAVLGEILAIIAVLLVLPVVLGSASPQEPSTPEPTASAT